MTRNEDEAVSENEYLGREVFSRSSAKRARRNRIPFRVFLEREGIKLISVDRLDNASVEEATSIAGQNAIARNASFYGWAVVLGAHAMADERKVVPSPTSLNPFHADIVLPDQAALDREEQKSHAQNLADQATWREGGT